MKLPPAKLLGLFLALALPTRAERPLQLWVMPTGPHTKEMVQDVVAEFTTKTGNRVDVTVLDWGEAWSRIETGLREGKGPDVLQVGSTWVPYFASKHWLASLEPHRPALQMQRFVSASQMAAKLDGSDSVWAAPWMMDARTLMANRRILSSLGIKGSDIATTDGYRAVLEKIKAARLANAANQQVFPFGYPGGSDWNVIFNIAPWVWSAGGELVRKTPQGWRSGLLEPATFRGILTYASLAADGLTNPATLAENTSRVTQRFQQVEQSFIVATPELLTMVRVPSSQGGFSDNKIGKDGIDPYPIPSGPAGSICFVGGSLLGMPAKPAPTPRAISLLLYLTQPKSIDLWAKKNGFFPPDKNVLQRWKEDSAFKVVAVAAEKGRSTPNIPQWSAIENEFNEVFRQMWTRVADGPQNLDHAVYKLMLVANHRIDSILGAPPSTPLSWEEFHQLDSIYLAASHPQPKPAARPFPWALVFGCLVGIVALSSSFWAIRRYRRKLSRLPTLADSERIPLHKSFFFRFVLILACVQILAMGGAGYWFFRTMGNVELEKSRRTNQGAVENAASYVRSDLDAFGKNVAFLATTPNISGLDPIKAGEALKSTPTLNLFFSGEEIVLRDAKGKRVADNRALSLGGEDKPFPWAAKVEGIRPFAGPVQIREDLHLVPFAAIAMNLTGESGMVTAEYSLRRLASFFENFQVGTSGFVLLTDRRGNIHWRSRTFPTGDNLDQVGLKDLDSTLWTQGKPVVGKLSNGSEYLLNRQVAGNYDLAVLTLQPMDEIHAAARSALLGVLLLTALILAATVAITAYLSLKMIQPLRVLTTHIRNVREGQWGNPTGIHRADEIGVLATGFDLMRETIRIQTEHLEDLVRAKMRQVRDILENIDQGLFTVNLDGTVNDEYSVRSNSIFKRVDISKHTVFDLLRLSQNEQGDWRSWVELVRQKHKLFRWEKLTKVAPVKEIEQPGGTGGEIRLIGIEYQAIVDDAGDVGKIMILAKDLTDKRRTENRLAQEREKHEKEVQTILGLVNHLPEILQEYLEDVSTRLDNLDTHIGNLRHESQRARREYPTGKPLQFDETTLSNIFRDLHTIKGNSATYGFVVLSHIAHLAENHLEALKPPVEERSTATLDALTDKVHELREGHEEILRLRKKLNGSDASAETQRISSQKVERLRQLVRLLRDTPETAGLKISLDIEDTIRQLRWIPLSQLAAKWEGLVGRLSERLGKRVAFRSVPANLELPPHFLSAFEEPLNHMLRNSLDHAMESPEDRQAAGKPTTGNIVLEVIRTEGEAIVALEDDGRGIDTDRLVQKALANGLLDAQMAESLTYAQKLELIFADGLSTSEMLTELSGRGVGMAAVRQSMRERGGEVELSSTRGKGTRIVLRLPLDIVRSLHSMGG